MCIPASHDCIALNQFMLSNALGVCCAITRPYQGILFLEGSCFQM